MLKELCCLITLFDAVFQRHSDFGNLLFVVFIKRIEAFAKYLLKSFLLSSVTFGKLLNICFECRGLALVFIFNCIKTRADIGFEFIKIVTVFVLKSVDLFLAFITEFCNFCINAVFKTFDLGVAFAAYSIKLRFYTVFKVNDFSCAFLSKACNCSFVFFLELLMFCNKRFVEFIYLFVVYGSCSIKGFGVIIFELCNICSNSCFDVRYFFVTLGTD